MSSTVPCGISNFGIPFSGRPNLRNSPISRPLISSSTIGDRSRSTSVFPLPPRAFAPWHEPHCAPNPFSPRATWSALNDELEVGPGTLASPPPPPPPRPPRPCAIKDGAARRPALASKTTALWIFIGPNPFVLLEETRYRNGELLSRLTSPANVAVTRESCERYHSR